MIRHSLEPSRRTLSFCTPCTVCRLDLNVEKGKKKQGSETQLKHATAVAGWNWAKQSSSYVLLGGTSLLCDQSTLKSGTYSKATAATTDQGTGISPLQWNLLNVSVLFRGSLHCRLLLRHQQHHGDRNGMFHSSQQRSARDKCNAMECQASWDWLSSEVSDFCMITRQLINGL